MFFSNTSARQLEFHYVIYFGTFATAKPAAATRQLLSPPSTACKSDPNRDSIAIKAEGVRNADATLSRPLTRARQSS